GCETERSRFGVNSVGSSYLRGVLEFNRALLEHALQGNDLRQKNVARVAEQQSIGGIDYIRRSEPVVYKPSGVTDRFREISGEDDNVMICCFLDFVDALHGKLSA